MQKVKRNMSSNKKTRQTKISLQKPSHKPHNRSAIPPPKDYFSIVMDMKMKERKRKTQNVNERLKYSKIIISKEEIITPREKLIFQDRGEPHMKKRGKLPLFEGNMEKMERSRESIRRAENIYPLHLTNLIEESSSFISHDVDSFSSSEVISTSLECPHTNIEVRSPSLSADLTSEEAPVSESSSSSQSSFSDEIFLEDESSQYFPTQEQSISQESSRFFLPSRTFSFISSEDEISLINLDSDPLNLINHCNVRAEKSAEQCSICLQYWIEEQEGIMLECGHIFHQDCIKKWLQTKLACPFCRRSLDK